MTNAVSDAPAGGACCDDAVAQGDAPAQHPAGASFFAEIAFMIGFKYVPYGMFDGEARLRLWLCLSPFACYFPLVRVWLSRRRHA